MQVPSLPTKSSGAHASASPALLPDMPLPDDDALHAASATTATAERIARSMHQAFTDGDGRVKRRAEVRVRGGGADVCDNEGMTRALALLIALAACGGAATQAPAPPSPAAAPAEALPEFAAIDSGKSCAKAEARCGGGACSVKLKNDCDAPVRCHLSITTTCDTQGGTSAANGEDHATIAAHEAGVLDAQAGCSSGPTVRTEVDKLSCK